MSSVKIRSDHRARCKCGGKFRNSIPMPGLNENDKPYKIPACEHCNTMSHALYIDANIADDTGTVGRKKINFSQDGKRISNYLDCIYTLRRIQEALDNKTFDAKDYAPKKQKEKLVFGKHLEGYLNHQIKRYEGKSHERKISSATLKLKKKYITRLNDYFGTYDIRSIKKKHIEEYKEVFPSTTGELYLTLEELRTILRKAKEKEIIDMVPEMGKIPKTPKRQATLEELEAETIIKTVKDSFYQRMYQSLYLYPVRPCDIRALRWKNVDLIKGEVTFNEHISNGEPTPGRKSQIPGETYAEVTLPISPELRMIFNQQRAMYEVCFPDDFVFRGKRSPFVGETNFNKNWRDAAKECGFVKTKGKKYDLYELKHLAITRLFELTNSVLACSKASGISERTILERYIKNKKKLKTEYFTKGPKLRIVGS